VFSLGVVSSIAHYTDNTINFDEYPHPEPGSIVPDPPDWLVASSWFAFTAIGLLGLWWYAQHRMLPAAAAIAVYSVSGTISIGHDLAPGATDMAPLRQAAPASTSFSVCYCSASLCGPPWRSGLRQCPEV
jgi:hypothetical protein